MIRLQQLTKGYQPSFEVPFCWQALFFMCRKLKADLREHTRSRTKCCALLVP